LTADSSLSFSILHPCPSLSLSILLPPPFLSRATCLSWLTGNRRTNDKRREKKKEGETSSTLSMLIHFLFPLALSSLLSLAQGQVYSPILFADHLRGKVTNNFSFLEPSVPAAAAASRGGKVG